MVDERRRRSASWTKLGPSHNTDLLPPPKFLTSTTLTFRSTVPWQRDAVGTWHVDRVGSDRHAMHETLGLPLLTVSSLVHSSAQCHVDPAFCKSQRAWQTDSHLLVRGPMSVDATRLMTLVPRKINRTGSTRAPRSLAPTFEDGKIYASQRCEGTARYSVVVKPRAEARSLP